MVGQVVSTMEDISACSKKISDITSVIDGIAFQTNILALNAAVEAARAGEQGRGFAVVAGEVRRLAQHAAIAAKEIKSLIGQSAERVETGSRLVGEAGATMGEIVSQIQEVSSLISEIDSATRQQTIGIDQVSGAVAQLRSRHAAEFHAGGGVRGSGGEPEAAGDGPGRNDAGLQARGSNDVILPELARFAIAIAACAAQCHPCSNPIGASFFANASTRPGRIASLNRFSHPAGTPISLFTALYPHVVTNTRRL